MNKYLLAAAALSVSITAQADPQFYLGVGVTQSTIELENFTFDDVETTNFNIKAGVQFNDYVAIELRHHFESDDDKVLTDRYDYDNSGENYISEKLEVTKTEQTDLLVRLSPITGSFRPYLLLGMSKAEVEIKYTLTDVFYGDILTDSDKESDTDTAITYGIGAIWDVSSSISLTADYVAPQWDDTDSSQLNLAAQYRF